MAGNVYEWCRDYYYGENYYKVSPADDPTGPETGDRRALRSGAWISDPCYCRPTVRSDDPPGRDHQLRGFRRTIVPPQTGQAQ